MLKKKFKVRIVRYSNLYAIEYSYQRFSPSWTQLYCWVNLYDEFVPVLRPYHEAKSIASKLTCIDDIYEWNKTEAKAASGYFTELAEENLLELEAAPVDVEYIILDK